LSGKLRYASIESQPRAQLEAAFASNDEDALCNAMYSAAQHEPDWRWVQGELLKLLISDRSLRVRSTAIQALGELVLFRGHVDVELVLPEIHKLRNDSTLAPFVKEYLEDVKSRIAIH
jgi:hypothetical protein